MDKLNDINSIELETFDFDCSEILNLSSLSLIKMLRHGKAGIPVEVMGLMLGKFIDQIPNDPGFETQNNPRQSTEKSCKENKIRRK